MHIFFLIRQRQHQHKMKKKTQRFLSSLLVLDKIKRNMFRTKKKTRKTTYTKKRQQRCLAKQNKIYRKLTINNIESACALLFFFSFLWSCVFFFSRSIFLYQICATWELRNLFLGVEKTTARAQEQQHHERQANHQNRCF